MWPVLNLYCHLVLRVGVQDMLTLLLKKFEESFICMYVEHNGWGICLTVVGISNSTYNFLLLDRIGNCLIMLALANHEDCHFRFQNWSRDSKTYYNVKANIIPLFMWWHSSILNLHIVQPHHNKSLFYIHCYMEALSYIIRVWMFNLRGETHGGNPGYRIFKVRERN